MIKKLSDVVDVNTRFCRSINISQDQNNVDILAGFICPSSSEHALLTIADNLSATEQAAFTWTGPYGSGKSSLALLLSSFVGKDKKIREIATSLLHKDVVDDLLSKIKVKKGWEVFPVVGDNKSPEELIAAEMQNKGYHIENDDIFTALGEVAAQNDGLIIFIDEMGKCLEAAARKNGDVYFLQKLAEFASRSQKRIILIGILHQAFAAYARSLPHAIRDEWIKIQGRFVDIPINTAGEEQIELIGRAIESDSKPKKLSNIVKDTVRIISKNKIVTSPKDLEKSLNLCWPINPVVICLLSQISRKRFGQNQRSIFSFLSSGEPKALRDFLKNTEFSEGITYMPEDLFDYLQLNLEASILASTDSKIWNIAVDGISRCKAAKGGSVDHVKVLKTISLVEIFKGSSSLTVDLELLKALYYNVNNIEKIIEDLKKWSFIIERQSSFYIYEGSDFDIDKAFREAYSNIIGLDISKLSEIANFRPVIAKRHYHEFGCMRWLDVLLTPLDKYEEFLMTSYSQTKSAGFFSIFLPQSVDEENKVNSIVKKWKNEKFPVIMTVANNSQIISEYLRELLALEWIQKNKGDLAGDSIARREIENRQNIITSLLEAQLNIILTESEWYFQGKKLGKISHQGLSVVASKICDDLFSKAPKIRSELVNRTKPSGSANSALNALLKDMVINEGKDLLEIEGFTPERGLYNILLQDTGIYDGSNYLVPKTHNLDAVWTITDNMLKEINTSITLVDLYKKWELPPLGIKAGLHSFIALAYMLTRKNKIAVYREGSYIPEVNDLLVDYLIKSPKTIAIKLVEAEDVSGHILSAISQVLNTFQPLPTLSLKATPLAIARKMVSIVDKLQPWVLKTRLLSKTTIRFREAVKSASDPNKLLFEDMEKIFISANDNAEDKTTLITKRLKESLQELMDIYPATIQNVAVLLTGELDVPLATPANLEKLRERAKNIKGVSGNFRMDAFAARISTFEGTFEDIAGIISLANNKPPKDWIDLDVETAKKEILVLCTEFKKTELYTKVKNRPSSRRAVAFITGIGGNTEVFEGEFDILNDYSDDVKKLKEQLTLVTENSKIDRNVLLAALTEMSIEYLKAN